jgi:hypothetical protein
MSDLKAQGGELRATIQVKRAATGIVETFEIVGHTDPEKLAALVEQSRRVHSASGAMVGPGAGINHQSQE